MRTSLRPGVRMFHRPIRHRHHRADYTRFRVSWKRWPCERRVVGICVLRGHFVTNYQWATVKTSG